MFRIFFLTYFLFLIFSVMIVIILKNYLNNKLYLNLFLIKKQIKNKYFPIITLI